MCSIVKISGKLSDIQSNYSTLMCKTLESLIVKGDEQYGVVVRAEYKKDYFSKGPNLLNNMNFKLEYEMWETLDKHLNNYLVTLNGTMIDNIVLLFHSRQAPEMESSTILQQPYITSKGDAVAVHGTIPHAEEIAKKYDFKIGVDTDIFKFLNFDVAIKETEEVGGKITAISNDKQYSNGLGLYEYINNFKVEFITNIYKPEFKELQTVSINDQRPIHFVVLATGGLDVTLSALKIFDMAKDLDLEIIIDHWYFNWESNASEGEISTVKKQIEFYKSQYPNLTFNNLHVYDFKNTILEIISNANIKSLRLSDENAIGEGLNEAESAISYVPYRNTFLITSAASIAEQKYANKNVHFVIGANLSEGMIYLDNSTEWVQTIDKLVRVGGQKCSSFSVTAPFMNKTKTNMIKEMKPIIKMFDNFNLNDFTFSCYFPENGVACGKCGSCLLKAAAIQRSGI